MRRPAHPWLLPLSAAFLAAGILLGREADALWPGLAALGCGIPAALLLRRRGRLVALLACAAALGCMLGHQAFHPALPSQGNSLVRGVITDDIRLRDDGQVRTILHDVHLNGQPQPGGAYWTFYLQEGQTLPDGLSPGMLVSFRAQVYHPEDASTPGGYNFREHTLQQGVLIGVYGQQELTLHGMPFHLLGQAAALRHRLTQRLLALMGEEAGSYAAALVLGSRTHLPEEDKAAFNSLGIAHILSVSGFHVGVLVGILRFLLRRLHLSRRVRLVLTACILGGYCLLTGLHPPVLRAVLLYCLWEAGMLLNRPRSSLHLLAAAWCIILIGSPVQLTSGSFLLTFGAMLGLTVLRPWLEDLHTFRHTWVQRIWQAFCASTAAQLGILLPQLFIFHEVPLWSFLINPLVISLSSAVIGLCWVVVALLPLPPLAGLLGAALAQMMEVLLRGIRALGAMQHTVLWTGQANWLTLPGWAMLLFSLSHWWRGRHRAWAAALGVVAMVLSLLPMPGPAQYIQFSAGEADAAILQDGLHTTVIDTGENGFTLAAYLHQQRRSIDDLIITHLHSDHAGGMLALLEENIPVRRLYLPVGAEHALIDPGLPDLVEQLRRRGTEVRHLARGDVLPLPHGRITVLWPEEGRVRPGQDANASCLALLIQVHDTSILHMADLTGAYERYAAHPADLLKVAHHGSESSTSAAFLAEVSPQALLLSSGEDARGASMLRRSDGLPLYNTDQHGAITVTFRPGGFSIATDH